GVRSRGRPYPPVRLCPFTPRPKSPAASPHSSICSEISANSRKPSGSYACSEADELPDTGAPAARGRGTVLSMNRPSAETHSSPSAVWIAPTELILLPFCDTSRPLTVSGTNNGVGRWYRTFNCAVGPLQP